MEFLSLLRHARRFSTPCISFHSLNFDILSSTLDVCTNIQYLYQIHARFFIYGLQQNQVLASKLVSRYADLGNCLYFERVFQCVRSPNLVLCNTIIKACCRSGLFERAIMLYKAMLLNSTNPDEFTLPSVLKACSYLSVVEVGLHCHCHAVKLGLGDDVFVGTALVDMYSKCGKMESAHQLFDEMPVRNLISWNILINGFNQNGEAIAAVECFNRMRADCLHPDSGSFVSVLQSCTKLGCLRIGKTMHLFAILGGFNNEVLVGTSLVTMYAKVGELETACKVFNSIPQGDVVLWNALLSGYNNNKCPERALRLFIRMQAEGIEADSITFTNIISAAADLRSLEEGRQIHGRVIRIMVSELTVPNSLIDFYSKCGKLECARKVFDRLMNKTVVSWGSMINAYILHEQYLEALSFFKSMLQEGVKIDSVSLINVLPACVHLSALQIVKDLHGCVVKSGLSSNVSLVTSLLVSYAKCGNIECAEQLFHVSQSLQGDLILWNSMINAYAMSGDWNRCISLNAKMQDMGLNPDHLTFLGLLTAYKHAGLVEEALACFGTMKNVHGFQPENEHYICIIDLLGRSGRVQDAKKVVEMMPFEPDSRVLGALLSASKTCTDTSAVELSAARLLNMEPANPGNYVLLSNMYAEAGMWHDVQRIRSMLKGRGLKKITGYSWIETNGVVHAFHMRETSHPKSEEIFNMLKNLYLQMNDQRVLVT